MAQEDGTWKTEQNMDFSPSLGSGSFEGPIKVYLTTKNIPVEEKLDQGEHFFRREASVVEEASIELGFSMESYEDLALFAFIRVLEDIPIGVFGICKECHKYFLHFGKHKKLFCTNLCAARHGARRRRRDGKEKDPEGYAEQLAANAERAHKSYEKKVQEKHSPALRVKRQPIKHKKG
jgi:hypothetical protein